MAVDLGGKLAVVTGGAGLLGRRFCMALLKAGARVVALDVPGDSLNLLAGEAPDARLTVRPLDVTDVAAVRDGVAAIESDFGPIEILLNNAASKGPSLAKFLAPVETYDLETWRAVTAVNLDGMFLMAQAVGTRMAQRGAGSIVQTASIYGVIAPDPRIYEGSFYEGHPISSPPVYAATKAAVIGLTRYLAAYWGPRGVRVNALSPGGVESGQNEVFRTRYGARVPMGRMAQPDEIEEAALFLASDAARYITGQNLVVDGGLSIW